MITNIAAQAKGANYEPLESRLNVLEAIENAKIDRSGTCFQGFGYLSCDDLTQHFEELEKAWDETLEGQLIKFWTEVGRTKLSKKQVKILLESATTVEEAVAVISKNYHFESTWEKVEFLKYIFGIRIIEYELNNMDYFSILATIINHAEK